MHRPNAARLADEEDAPLLEKEDAEVDHGERHDWPKLGFAVLIGALSNLLSILDRNFWAASSNYYILVLLLSLLATVTQNHQIVTTRSTY